MVIQYPHNIEVLNREEPVQNTATGKFTVAAPSTFNSECRAEPNGKGSSIRGADGIEIVFDFVVFMPLTNVILKYGSKVTLTLDDGSIYSGTLKRQHNGQLNSRLWV